MIKRISGERKYNKMSTTDLGLITGQLPKQKYADKIQIKLHLREVHFILEFTMLNSLVFYSDTARGAEKATTGLARVGTRAALSFAFAFLRRAWRSGEDADLCSELLKESLDALRALPEATLFEEMSVSAVWLEVVDRAAKFLTSVVQG